MMTLTNNAVATMPAPALTSNAATASLSSDKETHPASPLGQGRVLSPSQVSQFLECQAKWYYSAIAQLPDPATGSLAFGKAMHATIAVHLRLRGQGEHPTHADLAEFFAHTLKIELGQAELRPDEDPAALLDEGLRMLAMWAGQIAQQIEAASVELQVHGLIGSQHVRGIVDVITTDGIVVDLKTSAKKPGAISASYYLQLATYGILTGKRETRLITMARTKMPSWNQHSLTLTPQHTQYAATMYDMAAESMASGLFLPHRGSNLCSRKHCAFWRECEREYGGCID